MPFTFTAHRAILDWHRRPRSRRERAPGGADTAAEDSAPGLPGVVGMTKHQLRFELDDRLAGNLLGKCDEALADETISEAKRGQIDNTRTTLLAAIAAYHEGKSNGQS